LVLGEESEDGLGPDNDHSFVSDDLARRPELTNRMLKLVTSHQLTGPRTSDCCSCEGSPRMGETSRISTASVSSPVITRRRLAGRRPR
jgi:hypothetical protein